MYVAPVDLTTLYNWSKYFFAVLSAVGLLYTVFKAITLLGRVFRSLQKFLDEQLPEISTSLDNLKEHADLAMSNHLPHIQVAAESMATSLDKLTTNFRDYEVSDAAAQATILSQITEVRNDIKEKL